LTRLLGIELALQQGDAARAASLLDRAAQDRPELLLQAQTALQWRQQTLGMDASARVAGSAQTLLSDTLQRLQSWVHGHPSDAGAWQALARVALAQNLGLQAIRAEAEVQAANLDLPAAVDRFKAAQDFARKGGLGTQAGDHIEASIIDTRLRQIQTQSKELTKEQAQQR
jgi:predicted Zn-dependent protease